MASSVVSPAMNRSLSLLYRAPKVRRPRERAWEVLNTRDFGFEEGSQNYRMWALTASVALALLFFESYKQMERIMSRGDSCPACEAARKHYKVRAAGGAYESLAEERKALVELERKNLLKKPF